MPLLLKPAPTRLRLVLWSLINGLDVFPESPPPGLVTIPADKAAHEGSDTMSGYRIAGERGIRIDMLERLADMLRSEDSRGGFEAKADMLSITGMTLEQFADLMQGLGYQGEKGERAKVKAAPAAEAEAAPEAVEVEAPAEAEVVVEETTEASAEPAAEAEMEVFYTFTWSRPPRANTRPPRTDDKPKGKGKPQGKGRNANKGPREDKSKSFSARPPKPEKKIDPDNPFAAALMGLKSGK
jgi:ATP-dependent RNA helicase SUPV3L1/SUV3